ncbi:HAD-IIA family hydrolase [Dysosmobacter sp.]|uniref:HAD-IIA family hydrolase n=1 Tax=Dysosmobacter sp. TaxID=2591382 RepID=UPI002A8BE298|nr:HAD-IIA family hydrolase [Dysosmobacter sp.]MDY3985513.1 HAD-IIA family hydrolase [Dysosmobacter sp.]
MDLAVKKLFLLDLDGTVYLEDELLPGAEAFLAWVLETGGTVRYLTNNSSRGVDAGLEKMRRLGVPAEREEFLTAVEATVYYLRTSRSPSEVYYVVGTDSFRRQLAEAGFRLREEPAEDVTAVLVGFDTELTYRKVENACRLLARGADFLATNPDWACPTLFGFVPDCGAICELIGRGAGRKPVFIGKPDPTMIRLALEQTGCAPEEALMVGDRLYTDIACGVNAGVDTALVLTGEATAADAAVSDTPPSLICRDMAELLERLKEVRGT